MGRVVKVSTIEEEFEKSRIKAHVRTRKGKLERVKEFERKGGAGKAEPYPGYKKDISYIKKIYTSGDMNASADIASQIGVKNADDLSEKNLDQEFYEMLRTKPKKARWLAGVLREQELG